MAVETTFNPTAVFEPPSRMNHAVFLDSPTVVERIASILLIIPALNEEGCIDRVVRLARTMLPDADILVIDDGSRDDTARIARHAGAFVVSHPFNLGIGGAVQTGLKFARQQRYDYVLRIDGDGQHDPEELARLLDVVRAGRADVAVGSRFLGDGLDMQIPLLRRVGIVLFAREVSLLTGRRATDPTSGMTAMNRRAIDVLASFMPQDYPEVEGRIILHTAGLTVEEVPVHIGERLAGVSSINRWRSMYYAMKVTLAVLLTALKKVPRITTESSEVTYADRPVVYRNISEPRIAYQHSPAHSRTQAT